MAFNLKKNIAMTMVGKTTILLLNFLVVVLTTQFWGAEGRGVIAMFVADVSLLAIVANIFTGSSVSYYLSKAGYGRLFSIAMLWVSLTSVVGAGVFYLFEKQNLTLFFLIISIFTGIIAFFNSLYIGGQRIRHYNMLTVLQPFLLVSFMLFFFYFVDGSYRAYFYAQMLSMSILSVVCLVLERKSAKVSDMKVNLPVAVRSFKFGFKTELSNFLQFFNYRLSFYFLTYYVGNASVGIFSIGVTLAEAVWIVSRSISMVQYSRLLDEKNEENAIKGTNQVAKYSFFITLGVLIVANLIPSEVYRFVFGTEFGDVKKVLMILSPGVLAIAVSNVFGHYFSARGQLDILVAKSWVGVLVTLLLSFAIVARWQLVGAAVTNLTSNIVTSIILFVAYWRHLSKETCKN